MSRYLASILFFSLITYLLYINYSTMLSNITYKSFTYIKYRALSILYLVV